MTPAVRSLPQSATAPSRGFLWFKTALFALLVLNACVFAFSGTASEALDAAAWVLLLALFELETGFGERFGPRRRALIRAIRLVASTAIAAAAVGYLREGGWLDATNAWLWIAVVVLLEYEVRHAGRVARHRKAFGTAAATLYGGLAAVVAVWAWRGEWFDAYDASLWLIAFAAIEMNVLKTGRSGARPA